MHEIIRKLQFWKEPCALHKVRTVKILSNEFVDSGKLQNFTGISDESNLHDLETKGYFDENSHKEESGRYRQLSMEPTRYTINFGINYYNNCGCLERCH